MSKIPINGIKLNGPLVALRMDAGETKSALPAALYRLLTDNCVNIAYMTAADVMPGDPTLCCCIDRSDADKVSTLIDDDPQLRGHVRPGADVGLLSFYPHRSSFKILGLALQLFGDHQIRVYGMASSISALSFVVAFEQLEDAGTILSWHLELPDSATPPWAAIKTRQQKRHP